MQYLRVACASIMALEAANFEPSFVSESGQNYNILRLAWRLVLDIIYMAVAEQPHDESQSDQCCQVLFEWLDQLPARENRNRIQCDEFFRLFIERDDDIVAMLDRLCSLYSCHVYVKLDRHSRQRDSMAQPSLLHLALFLVQVQSPSRAR